MTYEPFDPLDAPDAGKVGGQLTVRNILRSYHSNYDLFAEAVQNAVDAVHARWRDDVAYEPRLLIRIDLVKNSFTVIDNGVGMTPDTCARAFAPNYSLKAALLSGPSRRLRGHKGVGATFLSYGFNLTQMSSKYMGETWSGEIRDARRWADGTPESKAPLVAPYTEQDQFFLSLDRGTLVRVQCDASSSPARLLAIASSLDSWEAILRTDTAIGIIPAGAEPGFAPAVRLEMVTTDLTEVREISSSYYFPHLVPGATVLDLREFLSRTSRPADIDPRDKNKEGIFAEFDHDSLLQEFPVLAESVATITARVPTARVWAYGFQSYGTEFFERVREQLGGNRASRRHIRAGLRIASDSMVIGGERRLTELTRYTFSGNTTHVLVHIDGIEPDIGRKGFDETVEAIAQQVAKVLVEDYFPKGHDLLRSQSTDTSDAKFQDWVFDMRQRERDTPLRSPALPRLHITSVPGKEQDVVALFNQIIGAEMIIGYEVLATGTHTQYDSLVRLQIEPGEVQETLYHPQERRWGIERVRADALAARPSQIQALEFKLDLIGLIRDLRSNKKKFDALHLVVAWEAGAGFARINDYPLRALEFPLDISARTYPGQTHELRSAENNTHTVRVILLKNLLEQLSS